MFSVIKSAKNRSGIGAHACNKGVWLRAPGRFPRLAFSLLFLGCGLWPMAAGLYCQTELGSEDDLIVLGKDGNAADPDTEIKGFSVFGATQAAYTGAVAGPGNVVVNGVLSVSSGSYFVGNSTFTAAAKVFINDGSAGQLLSKNSGGYLQWTSSSSIGDNLGSHIATTTLQMGAYGVNTSSSITAAHYQINGSTVLAVSGDSVSLGILSGGGTGGANVFAGAESGYGNTTGGANTFVGKSAGYSNTTGGGNSFFGKDAGLNSASGDFNTFIGLESGKNNLTGYNNTYVGYLAGSGNNSGSYNSYFGDGSGVLNHGSFNTLIGSSAGGLFTTTTFSSSTLVGAMAGYNLTAGSDNIFLGWKAGYSVTTGTGNIVIGYDQRTPVSTTNNFLNIGGVLYGDLSAKTVGISTRVPQAALDVVSTGTAANIYAQIWRNASGVEVASMTSEGTLYATIPPGAGAGDNLGNHVATTTLDMAQFPVTNVSSIAVIGSGIQIATSVYAGASGVFISTSGAIYTLGKGNGTAYPGARGIGAVDLQNSRSAATEVAQGVYSFIGGGQNNMATAQGSVISGGTDNIAKGTNSVVSGGLRNEAWDWFGVVGGGIDNVAEGGYSAIGGGDGNWTYGSDSVIAGGTSNTADGQNAAIGGGANNDVFGGWATVPGGQANNAAGQYSFAAGYKSSSAGAGSFTWADSQGVVVTNNVADRTVFKNRGGFLVTGSTNPAMSGTLNRGVLITGNGLVGISTGVPYAALDVVSTGTAANIYAQIWRNASGVEVASMTSEGTLYATVAKGDNLGNHTATADLNMSAKSVLSMASMTMVGKGLQIGTDLTSAAYGIFISSYGSIMTIGAGHPGSVAPGARGIGAVDLQTYRTNASSVAAGAYSVAAGGRDNRAGALYSGVLAGYNNTAGEEDATVSGGEGNRAGAWAATVSGGYGNTASGDGATVSGGIVNMAGYYSYATVSGGQYNTASKEADTVSGGQYNTASGNDSTVSGGNSNTASQDRATVSGGYNNTASEDYATVSGGSVNTASGYGAAVSGGEWNTASDWYATVSGGYNNTALGEYSWAAGYKSSSTADGSFTWADSQGVVVTNKVADRTVFKNRGGFLVTGSTNPAMSGTLNRGVLITGNGLVGISTGVPYAALDIVSTGTAANIYAQIWRNASGVEVASMTSEGTLYATVVKGDNLGNHTATQALDMSSQQIMNVSTLTVTGNAFSVGGSTLTVNAGNVGVGVADPTSKLEVRDNATTFQVSPQPGYVSLLVNGVEVARMK